MIIDAIIPDSFDAWTAVQVLLSFGLASIIANVSYLLLLHPLAKFPGPKLWALSDIPYLIATTRGDHVPVFAQLHKRYGPIVRYGPKSLSFADQRAWHDIMGFHKSPFLLNSKWYKAQPNGVPSLLSAPEPDHTRIRRLVQHAFSDRALHDQEEFLQKYIDTLIAQIHLLSKKGPVDLVEWFNYVTFDITGELAFADSYDSMVSERYRPFIAEAVSAFKTVCFLLIASYFPSLKLPIVALTPKTVFTQSRQHFENARVKTQGRIKLSDEGRNDFMAFLRRDPDKHSVSEAELESSFALLIAAGTETTATTLSAIVTLLLQHPEAHKRLVSEVRSAFAQETHITMDAVTQLPFLQAVIEEALRLCPPVPAHLPRTVPPQGAKVCDDWLPGGIDVSPAVYSMHHASYHFSAPDEFIPERWLPADALNAKPQALHETKAFRPFSYGMRDCVGRPLAYAEMRIILSKLLWNFDVSGQVPAPWEEQKSYIFWQKRPLPVTLIDIRK